jgi:zinc transport system permease protein
MDEFVQLWSLPAVQRSALALLVASLSLPVVGVFVVGLGILPLRFAVMHVALFGIAVGMVTGLDPTLCGLLACAAAGIGLSVLGRGGASLSGPSGLLMPFAIALALLVLSVSGVNANGAFELLWGSVLATRPRDIALLVGAAVAVQLFFWLRRAGLGLLLYDRELAAVSGVGVTALTTGVLVLTTVTMGTGLRLTGALMIDALTILPALTAANLASSLRSMVVVAVVVSLVGSGLGLAAALLVDQPPGPVLVLVCGLITLGSYLVPRQHSGAVALH